MFTKFEASRVPLEQALSNDSFGEVNGAGMSQRTFLAV